MKERQCPSQSSKILKYNLGLKKYYMARNGKRIQIRVFRSDVNRGQREYLEELPILHTVCCARFSSGLRSCR